MITRAKTQMCVFTIDNEDIEAGRDREKFSRYVEALEPLWYLFIGRDGKLHILLPNRPIDPPNEAEVIQIIQHYVDGFRRYEKFAD
jgi:hypothetical protein